VSGPQSFPSAELDRHNGDMHGVDDRALGVRRALCGSPGSPWHRPTKRRDDELPIIDAEGLPVAVDGI
jgi:hypothetical protein